MAQPNPSVSAIDCLIPQQPRKFYQRRAPQPCYLPPPNMGRFVAAWLGYSSQSSAKASAANSGTPSTPVPALARSTASSKHRESLEHSHPCALPCKNGGKHGDLYKKGTKKLPIPPRRASSIGNDSSPRTKNVLPSSKNASLTKNTSPKAPTCLHIRVSTKLVELCGSHSWCRVALSSWCLKLVSVGCLFNSLCRLTTKKTSAISLLDAVFVNTP